MIKLTKKELIKFLRYDWVKNITHKGEADKVAEPLECIAYTLGVYGVSGKMWRGRKSGDIYIAFNYSATLYRFN